MNRSNDIKFIRVKVTTKARLNNIKKEIMSDGNTIYKIWVTIAPKNGKANASMIGLISKEFNLPKSSVKVIKGLQSANKIVELQF